MPGSDSTVELTDALPVLRALRSPETALVARIDLLAALARLPLTGEVRSQVVTAIRAEFNLTDENAPTDVVAAAALLRHPSLNPLLADRLTQVDSMSTEQRLTIAMALAWSGDVTPLEDLLGDAADPEYDAGPFGERFFNSVLRWFAPLPADVAGRLPDWRERYRSGEAVRLLRLLDRIRAEPAAPQPPAEVSVGEVISAGGAPARDLLDRDPTLARISGQAQPLAAALAERLLTRACAMLDDFVMARECSGAAVRLAVLFTDDFGPDYERLFVLFRDLTSSEERFLATEVVQDDLGIVAGQGSPRSLVARAVGWLSAADGGTAAAGFLKLAATMRGLAQPRVYPPTDWGPVGSGLLGAAAAGAGAVAVGDSVYRKGDRARFRLPRVRRARGAQRYRQRVQAEMSESLASLSYAFADLAPLDVIFGERDSAQVVSTGFATLRHRWRPRGSGSPLRPGGRYLFWFEIGAAVAGAVDVEPTQAPLDGLPPDAKLQVVLFPLSGGFTVDPATASQTLVLAADGSVRRADAPPAGQESSDRRLFFRVRAPLTRHGIACLRCNLYHENFLLQSRVITAKIRPLRRSELDALRAEVDYSLTTSLDPALVSSIPGHSLSVLINEDDDATHGFYYYGGAELSRNIRVDKGDLGILLDNARAALRTASWGSGGTWVNTAEYRYGTADPDKRLSLLRNDLGDLARSGARLWDRLARDLSGSANSDDPRTLENRLRETMRQPGRVQVVGRRNTRLVLPAALLYDYPLDDPLQEPELCGPGMEVVQSGDVDAIAAHPCFNGQCPGYNDLATVCPGGFWGFRHEIGLPVTQDGTLGGPSDMAATILMGSRLRWTVGVSTDPKLIRRPAHQKILEELRIPVDWRLRDEVRTLLELFVESEPHVVYLLCHGGVTRDDTPFVEVGAPGVAYFTPSTLTRRYIRWPQTRPLVILNGCHTTELAPEKQLDFVTAFVQYCAAAGVIGTEITVFEEVACDFAEETLRRLLKDELPLGAAVKSARLALLAKLNPLGLVYTTFAQVGLQYHSDASEPSPGDPEGALGAD